MHVAGSEMHALTGQRICYTAVPAPRLPLFKPVSRCGVLHFAAAISDPRHAVIAEPTSDHPVPHMRRCSYAELYELVAALVSALLQHGVKPGDRVASYASNCIVSIPIQDSTKYSHVSPLHYSPCCGCGYKLCFLIHIPIGKRRSLPRDNGDWRYLGKRCCRLWI
jgi:hypothetical protein